MRVPPGAVLERSLTLPLAAESALDRVVAYEIDRISPFTAAEVAWAWGLDKRDRTAGRLHLRVGMLPRVGLEPALDALKQAGVSPGMVVSPREGGGEWRIRLAPAEDRGGRGVLVLAAVGCAALALVAAGLPFVL